VQFATTAARFARFVEVLTEKAARLCASTGTLLAQSPGFGLLLEAIDFHPGPSEEVAVIVAGKE